MRLELADAHPFLRLDPNTNPPINIGRAGTWFKNPTLFGDHNSPLLVIRMTADVHAEIDRQISLLHRTRSVFPRIGQELLGQKEFESPDYYRELGFNATVELPGGIKQEFIDGFFEIGHWINENFLLRLWAVLESNKIVSNAIKIDKELEGWKNVELLRRLRNKVGHGSGLYDAEDPDKKLLWDMLVEYYKLQPGYSYLEVDKYPIGVKQVLVPMAEGCKSYVTAFLVKNPTGPHPPSGASAGPSNAHS